MSQKPYAILTDQLRADYQRRIAAAGGHFKLLPLADDVPTTRAPRAAASDSVPAPPSLREALGRRRRAARDEG